MDFYAKGIKMTSRFLEQYGLPAEAGRVLPAFAKAMAGSLCYPRRLELARGIEPSTRRRFGSEACLTGSYKCMACQPKRRWFCPPSRKLWRAAFASREGWSWREESNLQPAVYKTAALPIELRQRPNREYTEAPTSGKQPSIRRSIPVKVPLPCTHQVFAMAILRGKSPCPCRRVRQHI